MEFRQRDPVVGVRGGVCLCSIANYQPTTKRSLVILLFTPTEVVKPTGAEGGEDGGLWRVSFRHSIEDKWKGGFLRNLLFDNEAVYNMIDASVRLFFNFNEVDDIRSIEIENKLNEVFNFVSIKITNIYDLDNPPNFEYLGPDNVGLDDRIHFRKFSEIYSLDIPY